MSSLFIWLLETSRIGTGLQVARGTQETIVVFAGTSGITSATLFD